MSEKKTFEFRTITTEWRVWQVDAEDLAAARKTFFEDVDIYDRDDQENYSKLADCKGEYYSVIELDEDVDITAIEKG